MFEMKIAEISKEIDEINNYIDKCLWMDFTFSNSDFGAIELFGAIDQTYNNYVNNYEIKIKFEQPYCVSTLFSWSKEDGVPFIELANEEETIEMNKKFRVEYGNYIFKINAEDFEEAPIWIAAKKISCNIINENPFPKN